MKIPTLIFAVLSALIVNSQVQDTTYLKLIGDQMRILQPNGILYYSDKLPQKNVERILKDVPLQLKKLKDKGIVLTDPERKYIIYSLNKALKSIQKDNLFLKSKRLSIDTLVPVVENINRREIDSIRQTADSLMIFKKNLYSTRWAFSFSEPIYLRQATILIYYFMYYLNSGGEEAIWVCKKEEQTWKKITVLGGGAW